jgi:zinc protease
LGGSSSGRINWNLRDKKGFTYGLSSEFPFRLGPSPFSLTGPVQTSATKESLVELMKEMVDLTGIKAITEEEIERMEANKVPQTFSIFETTNGIAGQIFNLIAQNRDDNQYGSRVGEARPVTADDAVRVAKQYFKPELMTILVVGDRTKIEGPLKSLPFVKNICLLDADGEAIPGPVVDKKVPTSK